MTKTKNKSETKAETKTKTMTHPNSSKWAMDALPELGLAAPGGNNIPA